MATVHFVHFTDWAQQEPCAPGLPFIAFLQTFHRTYFLSQAANPSLFRGQPGQITSPETWLCRWRSTALYCFAFPSLHGVLIIVVREWGHRGNVVGPIALNLDHETILNYIHTQHHHPHYYLHLSAHGPGTRNRSPSMARAQILPFWPREDMCFSLALWHLFNETLH